MEAERGGDHTPGASREMGLGCSEALVGTPGGRCWCERSGWGLGPVRRCRRSDPAEQPPGLHRDGTHASVLVPVSEACWGSPEWLSLLRAQAAHGTTASSPPAL